MKSSSELTKEIQRTRQHLQRLESKLQHLHYGEGEKMRRETERERFERIRSEFKRKYPNDTLHPDVLSVIGILPYATRAHDKEILRQALAEKYG